MNGHHRPAARCQTPAPSADQPINATELGNARRLIAEHGHLLRYTKSTGWHEWDGTRWNLDQTGAIWARRQGRKSSWKLGREASETEDKDDRKNLLKWAIKSEERKVLGATIDLAWSEPGISILSEELDADPSVLNTPSGTVPDLEDRADSGPIARPGSHLEDYVKVPFDPKAECPKWDKALLEILGGDPEMVAYVKRALGYSLTGFIGEHALFLCYGTKRNGKNTVLDTVATILKDYATVANPRTFPTAAVRNGPPRDGGRSHGASVRADR